MLEPLLKDEILPLQWILANEAFGRDTKLLNKIAAQNKSYFVEIPFNVAVLVKLSRFYFKYKICCF